MRPRPALGQRSAHSRDGEGAETRTRCRVLRDSKPEKLEVELDRYILSRQDEFSDRVDRLVRFAVRRMEPDVDVPWYPEIDVLPGKEPVPLESAWVLRVVGEANVAPGSVTPSSRASGRSSLGEDVDARVLVGEPLMTSRTTGLGQ